MPNIEPNFPIQGERPWGNKLNTALGVMVDAINDATEVVQEGRLSEAELSASFAPRPSPDVVLLFGCGQSNMEGRALPVSAELDFLDARVLMWDWATGDLVTATVPLSSQQAQSGFSVLTAIAQTILEREPVATVVIVNAGVGGSSLAEDGASGVWRVGYAGANPALYMPARDAALDAISATVAHFGVTPEVRMFWHQGEADSNAANYETYFDALAAQVRADLALPDMTITLGGIVPEYLIASPTRVPIRAVHVDTPARLVRTGYADGIRNGGGSASTTDIVHYAREGATKLGQAMWEAQRWAVGNVLTSVPVPPQQVTATFDGDTLAIGWSRPFCRVTEYVIEYQVDGGGWFTLPQANLELSASASGITSDSVSVRVSTVNEEGTSAPSTPVRAIAIPTADPVVPPGFMATFTQPDGHVQGTDDGKAWAAHVVSGAGSRIPLDVASGEAIRGAGGTASRTVWAVDSLLADGYFKAKIGVLGDSSGTLAFRVVDESNYIALACRADATTKQYRLQQRLAGTLTTLASTPGQLSVAADQIEVVLNGTSVTVKVNGANILGGAKTITNFATATKHGVILAAGSTGAETWAEVSMEPL